MKIHEPGECIALYFMLAEPLDLHLSIYDGSVMPNMKADFSRLLDSWNRRDEYSWCDCCVQFYKIMGLFLREVKYSDKYIQRGRYENIVRARDYLALNYNDPEFSVESAARLAGIEARRFGELFLLIYHIKPAIYITTLRIMSAQEMLRTNKYNVAEIALSVGFNSLTYFCRAFMREVEMSPAKWAKNGNIQNGSY